MKQTTRTLTSKKTNKHFFLGTILLLSSFAFSVFLFGCQTIPKNVPDDISEAELIQNAQESFDIGNYKGAIYYYSLLEERFGDDPRNIIVAKYETAHIYIKNNKWNDAEMLLNEAMGFYTDAETSDNGLSVLLSPAYKKLIQLDLNRIAEHNAK